MALYYNGALKVSQVQDDRSFDNLKLAVQPEAGIVQAPAHLDQVQAATLPCAARSAWRALLTHERLGP
ncbi:MAG: hypothetical protein FJY51_10170 [Betaproteobacteria bacterium]|nr:hypothetical protein [Betaproteobacteria bacterium]